MHRRFGLPQQRQRVGVHRLAQVAQRLIHLAGDPVDLPLGRGDPVRTRVGRERQFGDLEQERPLRKDVTGDRGLLGLLDEPDVVGKMAEADLAGDGDDSGGGRQRADQHHCLVGYSESGEHGEGSCGWQPEAHRRWIKLKATLCGAD